MRLRNSLYWKVIFVSHRSVKFRQETTMKAFQYVVLMTLVLVFLSACEGEEGKSEKEHADVTVPEAVQSAFSASYATATDVEWGMEDADFEVDFLLDGVESSVVYDASGNVLVVESVVAISYLPPSVMEYVNANYVNHSDLKAEMALKGIVTSYEIFLSHEGMAVELLFDQNGQFVEVAASEEDEDGATGEEADDDGESAEAGA